MSLARSSPTVLTWFMDASARGLQRPHSGTPRPPGASTPQARSGTVLWACRKVFRHAVCEEIALARPCFGATRGRGLVAQEPNPATKSGSCWLPGCWGGESCDQGSDKGAEQGFAAAACVVHELEEAEIEWQLVLRETAVRSQPGA